MQRAGSESQHNAPKETEGHYTGGRDAEVALTAPSIQAAAGPQKRTCTIETPQDNAR
jgi:hypothetical protein